MASMTRPLAWWLLAWAAAFHAAAALVPAIAGPVPMPEPLHTCPDPTVRHRVACPDPDAMARGAPWQCLHTTITDRCGIVPQAGQPDHAIRGR